MGCAQQQKLVARPPIRFRVSTLFVVVLLVATFLGGWRANDAYREFVNPTRDPATQLGIEYLNRPQNNDPGFRRLLELSQAESRP